MKQITWLLGLLLTIGLSRADLTFYVPEDQVNGAAGNELTMTVHVALNDTISFDVNTIYRGTSGFPVVHAYELQGEAGQAGLIQSFMLGCLDSENVLIVPSQENVFWSGPNDLPIPGETLSMPEQLVCEETGLGKAFLPESPDLLEILPNPSNPLSIMYFTLNSPGFTTIELFSMAGKRIKSVIAQNYAAGRHQVLISTEDLASGTYIAKLAKDGTFTTRTFSVVK